MAAAGNKPIFSQTPKTWWVQGAGTVANTTKDLTTGTIHQVGTAGAQGSRLDKLIVQALGTNIATVARIWLNNGSATGTAANNTLVKDVTLAATTNSETAAIGNTEVALDLVLQTGYKVYVTFGTAVAAGFDVTAAVGDY